MQAAVNAGTTPSSAGEGVAATRSHLVEGGATTAERRPDDVGPPGSRGPGTAGPMDTGANAGAGPGGPEDVDPTAAALSDERGEGGPTGSQDSGGGDLAEAGD